MTSPAATACRTHRKTAYLVALLTLLSLGSSCAAQQDDPAQENATMTLHVYTNLIQIPVLILGPFLDYAPKVDPKRLTVTLDHGKPFHPPHIRPEGDDPISLAILLDLSDDQSDVLPKLAGSLAKLTTQSLHPHDEVALYALDCTLYRVSRFSPPDADRMNRAVNLAMTSMVRDKKHHRSCGNAVHLFDAISVAAEELKQQSGRRVLLAISPGHDSGSVSTGESVHQLLVDRGVALFGLSPSEGTSSGMMGGSRGSIRMSTLPQSSDQPSSPGVTFHLLAELSGGIVRRTTEYSLARDLSSFIKTLRDRTIIEFPRPKQATAGVHNIVVELAKSRAFIRPAGIGVPVADPHIQADPTTIHPEDSPSLDAPPPATPRS
jgi:hypothetical protein